MSLFALLLAVATARHELWNDEMQAWLIARDNHSLASLFHSLRYEGHPSLWYLVLSFPSHLSANPFSMQIINYLFSITTCWLILSARKITLATRVMVVFSFFLFYNFGVIARSYMLAMLLLIAAARCLMGERQHRRLAIVLLALAINTHILAIPIAGAVAIWAFCFDALGSWKDTKNLFRKKEFIVAFAVLVASVAVAYLTVRPAPDLTVPLWPEEQHSLIYNFFLSEGRAWTAFFPATTSQLPHGLQALLGLGGQFSIFASVGSMILLVLVAVALRTKQARFLFLLGSVLELVAMAATVKDPPLRYFGLIFTNFLIALLVDAYAVGARTCSIQLPRAASSATVLVILGVQTLAAMFAWVSVTVRPFSEAKEVAQWLKQAGLQNNPLVVDGPDTTAVLGYMGRSSAYRTSCPCTGSYAVFRAGFDLDRGTTASDLRSARGGSDLPAILVHSGGRLDPAEVQRLGLIELHSFSPRPTDSPGMYSVYEQNIQ